MALIGPALTNQSRVQGAVFFAVFNPYNCGLFFSTYKMELNLSILGLQSVNMRIIALIAFSRINRSISCVGYIIYVNYTMYDIRVSAGFPVMHHTSTTVPVKF